MTSWSAVPASVRTRIRDAMAATLPAPCTVCGLTVHAGSPFHVDHRRAVALDPAGVLDLDNLGPAHPGCNLSKGARVLEGEPWVASW